MNCSCCGTQTQEESSRCNQKGSLFSMVLGPFPDEVIMQVLDGILAKWGATKIKSLADVQDSGPVTKEKSCPPLPSCPPSPSCPPPPQSCPPQPSSSACSIGRCSSYHSMNSSSCPSRTNDRKGKDSSMPSSPRTVCFNSSRISSAACCPRQPSTRVDFRHPADDIRKQKSASSFSMKERLMQAEIVCSSACQALKTRLKPKKSPREGCKGKPGLCTRLSRTKNGCQMYEVFKDSDADCSPPKIGSKAPAFIFLVLRNGNIMPFEAITPV